MANHTDVLWQIVLPFLSGGLPLGLDERGRSAVGAAST